MSNELKITKEKVLEAASRCKDAERTLRILFPEAFELFVPVTEDSITALIQVRETGKYQNRAFYLSGAYDWTLVKDELHAFCLVPTQQRQKL